MKRHLAMAPTGPLPPATYVVYRGPSMLDGAAIVAVLTGADGSSKNAKTGAMAQLWILLADVPPHEAQASGADASICGDCPLRPLSWREAGRAGTRCYVSMLRGPHAAWKASLGALTDLAGACQALRASGAPLRLGAYAEAAALPEHVVRELTAAASGHTGYTHQHKAPSAAWLKRFAMASVETAWQAAAARSAGWRTFRILGEGESPMPGEILCPYESRGVQCADCGLCAGAGPHKSIAIHAH